MNRYTSSDGMKYTESQIKRRLSDSYRNEEQRFWCAGCGQIASCHAHIIPKARCKQLHKTELIWEPKNRFHSCFRCNLAIENPKGKEWQLLFNKHECLEFIKQHDQELYNKFILNMFEPKSFSRLAKDETI